jgi:hypothetical protein
VHVGRLRGKLGAAGKQIETVVGLGYRFIETDKPVRSNFRPALSLQVGELDRNRSARAFDAMPILQLTLRTTSLSRSSRISQPASVAAIE